MEAVGFGSLPSERPKRKKQVQSQSIGNCCRALAVSRQPFGSGHRLAFEGEIKLHES